MKIGFLTTDSREHFKNYSARLPYFGQAPQALLEGFALLPEVELHVLSCARQRMNAVDKLAENTFSHSLLVPRLGWMSTAYQGTIRAVRSKLREIRPDIVHGQGTERDCAMNAVFSGFPNVLTIHGNMRAIARLYRAKPLSFFWLTARLEALVLPRTEGVICISRYTQAAVAPLARRNWLVPNAVDASFFDIQRRQNAGTTPRIICVGLVCPHKNQNALIRSLDALAPRFPFELVFLGHIANDEFYAREFRELLSQRSWCTHVGFADREQLKDWFSAADLLVLPSLEENCPMVVLEAMAASVPVVAAKIGGVPEQIEEGETGVFCDPMDHESMRTAVEKTLSNPAAARQMAARAKEVALKRFHPKVIATRHVEIYRNILERRR